MADGLQGSFADLARLIGQISALPDRARETTAKAFRLQLLSLVADGFRTATDPYGQAWAPLRHRNGEILLDTRMMANAFTCTDSFPLQITNNTPYVLFHQEGTSGGIPARRMVPDAGDLAPTWATALTQTGELVLGHLRAAMVP